MSQVNNVHGARTSKEQEEKDKEREGARERERKHEVIINAR